jgi:hypothetical protein
MNSAPLLNHIFCTTLFPFFEWEGCYFLITLALPCFIFFVWEGCYLPHHAQFLSLSACYLLLSLLLARSLRPPCFRLYLVHWLIIFRCASSPAPYAEGPMSEGMLSAKILNSSNLSHPTSKVVLGILHALTAAITSVTYSYPTSVVVLHFWCTSLEYIVMVPF